MTGTITFLHPRGFGFILADDGTRLFFASRFVDWESARRFNELTTGDRVTIGAMAASSSGSYLEAQRVRWLADSLERRCEAA
jgi:hypothetical protein